MCLNPNNLYIFVVDTDSYSGNFDTELCAYMTGVQGHKGSVYEYIDFYCKEMNISEDDYDHNKHVLSLPGEFGYAPCDLWPSPGDTKFPQSVGIFMDRRPTNEEMEILKERANKFQFLDDGKEKIKVLGFRLFHRKTSQTEILI